MVDTWCRQLLQMLVAVVFFHASEYALAVRFHGGHNVNASSLLISKEYLIAMTCALIEYVAEIILIPDLKEQWWLSNLGLALVVIGELIRKSAVITAGNAFTHNIRIYYEEDHDLVTEGIYSYEEFFLGQFFGQQYEAYAQKVPSGLPFIK
ncbi:unnamed protein product [Victoria cruziana]